jgi:hypothetical protein
MVGVRKRHDAALKARVALEAVREEKTIAQLSSEYKVHGNQIRQWKERPGRAFHSTSVFIIQSVFIPLWGITHLRRSMFKEERHFEITMDFTDYAPNT